MRRNDDAGSFGATKPEQQLAGAQLSGEFALLPSAKRFPAPRPQTDLSVPERKELSQEASVEFAAHLAP